MPKAVEKGIMSLLGPAAFYIGLLIALIAALVAAPSSWLYVGLAVLGVIVGLLNITAEQSAPFLLASIAFIVTAFGMQSLIATTGAVAIPVELTQLAINITVFVGSGAMLIALKAIYGLAKSR